MAIPRRLATVATTAALVTAALHSPAGADGEVRRVTVGSSPTAVGVDPGLGRVYVANTSDRTVSVIDAATGAIVATVTTGASPTSIAVDTTAHRVFVGNRVGNNVTVIDGSTNTAANVAVGTTPVAVAVNTATGRAFVANRDSNDVSVIDGASGTVVATVPVAARPVAVAVNETTNRAYVAGVDGDAVTVIDGAANASVATVAVGDGPQAVAVNETTNRVYVANGIGGDVSIIDGASNAASSVEAGATPTAVAVDERANRAYVVNVSSDSLTIIDGFGGVSNAGVGDSPVAVAANPATGKVYVSNAGSHSVSVVDPVARRTMRLITEGAPGALAIDEPANRIYAVQPGDRTLTVFEGASAFSNQIPSSRVAGADRYETAAALSGDIAPGVNVAYVTTGTAFPDALALGPVAGAERAALLLVRRDDVPPSTAAALERLQPDRIVVVGGTAAVSDAVQGQLGAYTAGGVTRIAGANRYATSVALSQGRHDGTVEDVYLVSGDSFADAISAGQAAHASGAPILLVRRDELPTVVRDELARLSPSRVFVAGGTAAVSDATAQAAGRAAGSDVEVLRVAGNSRYTTAVALAGEADEDESAATIHVATGASFADALTAAPAAIRQGGVLLLVPPSGQVPEPVIALIARTRPDRLAIVGGPGAVPDAIVDQLS